MEIFPSDLWIVKTTEKWKMLSFIWNVECEKALHWTSQVQSALLNIDFDGARYVDRRPAHVLYIGSTSLLFYPVNHTRSDFIQYQVTDDVISRDRLVTNRWTNTPLSMTGCCLPSCGKCSGIHPEIRMLLVLEQRKSLNWALHIRGCPNSVKHSLKCRVGLF